MLTKEEIQYKIDYEIIVDSHDEYEMSMGWYYFMEESITFPFKATAQLKKRDGSIEKKEVIIVGLSSDEESFMSNDFELEMETEQHINKISFSKLSNIKASAETLEAFTIWNYWITK